MRTAFGCILALGMTIGSLRADWKITTVYTSDGQRSVNTEYFKDHLRRSDFAGAHNMKFVDVVDSASLRQYMWDLNRREYVVNRLHYLGKVQATSANPPVYLVQIDARDTGERQVLFGRTARHLISTEKRYRQANATAEPVLQSEVLTDGWYVDAPGLPREKQANAVGVLAFGNQRPIVKVNHTGAPLSGLAVRQRITTRSYLSEQRNKIDERTIEVTELFQGSLANEVFEPPAGFKRVVRFPTDYRRNFSDDLEMYWQWFEDWFTSLFS